MTDFARTTIDDVDLDKYDRLGDAWWDPNGPMGALHKFNPVRVAWITDLLTREELAALKAGMAQLTEQKAGSDHRAIKAAIERLNHASEGFAARRMDRAVAGALTGQRLDEMAK